MLHTAFLASPLNHIQSAMYPCFKVFRYLKRFFLMGIAVSTFLTTGCSSSAKRPEIDHTKVKQFAARGYDSGTEYATSFNKLSLDIGDECCRISIVQPNREGRYPLVVYLPGLGESSDAGADLRNAWAKSGYVVLSLQALKDDENVWSSEAARNADFAYIRHERYSPQVVSERLNILTKVIEYLKQHVASGDPRLQHMDLSHIAIIGFDIGANSAMLVAGEEAPNIPVPGWAVSVSVVIALSPYADFSGSAFEVRYRNINSPVLSITSDADADVHGGVTPSLHQAPFQYMPPVNKYLLLLNGASHSVIGDGDPAKLDGTEGDSNSPHTKSGSNSEGSGNGRSNHHGKRNSNGGVDSGSPSKQDGGSSPTQRAMMEVIIEQVTTAFLNAHIKNDQLSLAWLKNDAQPWIDKLGQLREK
jgi:dienelactone hydrolase